MTEEQTNQYPAIDRALFLFKRRLGLNPTIDIEEKSNLGCRTPSITDSEDGEVSCSVDSLQSADSLQFKPQTFEGLKSIGVEVSDEIDEKDDSISVSTADNPQPQTVPIPHPLPTLPVPPPPQTIINVKEDLLTFLDDHAKDPLEIPYNFKLAAKLAQTRWNYENLFKKKSASSLQYLPSRYPLCKQIKPPDLSEINERFRAAIFFHSFIRWREFIYQRRSTKKLLQRIRDSLWTAARSRRFIPLKQQMHCVERFGKERLAQLYNRWRTARTIMTALIDNYLNDLSQCNDIIERDEEERIS